MNDNEHPYGLIKCAHIWTMNSSHSILFLKISIVILWSSRLAQAKVQTAHSNMEISNWIKNDRRMEKAKRENVMMQQSNDSFRDRITFMKRIFVGWCPSHRINFKMMHPTDIPSWITIVNGTGLWLKLELSKSIYFGHTLNWFSFSTSGYFSLRPFSFKLHFWIGKYIIL